MRIALFCATRRGLLFLEKLTALEPTCRPLVLCFREEPWEPPFFEAIRNATERCGGEFTEARKVSSGKWREFWKARELDLLLAVSWRYMIPSDVYRRARLGAYIFHDSMLPAYRGFSPTVWAMINGESQTGVTLFHMADEVDSGDIVDQQPVLIGPTEHIAPVMERVTDSYLSLLERNWWGLKTGSAPRQPQDHSQATYTCKRLQEDNRIDWGQSSQAIFNLIRAVSSPYPGASTTYQGATLKVWNAELVADAPRYVGRAPGRIVEIQPHRGVLVLTDDTAIRLTNVQLGEDLQRPADEVLRVGAALGS